ncbi:hypothetical protein ACPZ19_43695 [Amycolatopsis lurida]
MIQPILAFSLNLQQSLLVKLGAHPVLILSGAALATPPAVVITSNMRMPMTVDLLFRIGRKVMEVIDFALLHFEVKVSPKGTLSCQYHRRGRRYYCRESSKCT